MFSDLAPFLVVLGAILHHPFNHLESLVPKAAFSAPQASMAIAAPPQHLWFTCRIAASGDKYTPQTPHLNMAETEKLTTTSLDYDTSQYPFCSAFFDPEITNGVTIQNLVDNVIPYSPSSSLDYFEVVDGRGGT